MVEVNTTIICIIFLENSMKNLRNRPLFGSGSLNSSLQILKFMGQATALILAGLSSVYALGEVNWINFEEVAATPTTYTLGDSTYHWGTGVDRKITSFVYDDITYEYKNLANKVEIRRVNNDLSTGERCTLFVEKTADFNYVASYPYLKK
jgi:hypothetical protein